MKAVKERIDFFKNLGPGDETYDEILQNCVDEGRDDPEQATKDAIAYLVRVCVNLYRMCC